MYAIRSYYDLFAVNGIAAVIADPNDFLYADGELRLAGEPVDLIYNRLTDFAFDATVNADLRAVS